MHPHPADATLGGAVVPQHCLLVLPSTGAFDSRMYRIASTLAGRGHEVTVLARLGPGLPAEERHPAGYRIVRVAVSAADGLPGPLRWFSRAVRRRRPAGTAVPAGGVALEPRVARRAGGPRRLIASLWRLAAIGLTVRSQARAAQAVAPRSDLVHAMAYMGIPVGLGLGRRDGAPVIYDARDIYVDAANLARLPGVARAIFGRIERRWAQRASRVITVNEPYAGVMTDRFAVTKPLVVLNCSYRTPWIGRGRRFHETLGLADDARIVLYHGGLSPDRGIDELIAALPALKGPVHLVLMGYGVLETRLRERAAGATEPGLAGRLHVLPAVPPTELIKWVGSADVAAMPIQPSTLNHRLTTPNKLFEAMAAGVPIVASDLPGMAGIVRETGCGLLVDPTDSSAIATALATILDLPAEAHEAMGRRGHEAHLATYNWEAQGEILLAEYGRLSGRPW